MAVPGPPELGRGAVVLDDMSAPADWEGCPVVRIDRPALEESGPARDALRAAWLERRPVVVKLAVDSKTLQEPETWRGPVHGISPRFDFLREQPPFPRVGEQLRRPQRRADLVAWAQGGEDASPPKASTEADPADIELSDGTPLYVDGGPFGPPRVPGGIGIMHRWNTEAGSLRAVGDAQPQADLAADQLAAVGHATGGARVIAPAGSGKTRVLTERLRYLLEERGVDPSTVTVLAYNKKAADELKERCGDLVTARGPHIRTLNSVGLFICNEFGGSGRLSVLEEPRVRELVQQVFEVRRQANTDTVLPYIDALSSSSAGPYVAGSGRGGVPGRSAAWPKGSTPTGKPWPRRAPSTSTSRSTERSRSCYVIPRHGARPSGAAGTCWSTSSRISTLPTCC